MAKTTTTRLAQTRWSSGTDTVRRVDFDTDAANLESLVTIYAQGLLSARPSPGTSGRFYILSGESDTKLNGRIFYDNGSVWSAGRYLTDAVAEATASGNIPLTAKGVSGQTVDIFRVTDNTDAAFLRVTNAGVTSNQATVGVSGGAYFGSASSHDAAASLISVAVNKPTLLIKGIASQTDKLISARDSTGATMFSLATNGDGIFNGSVTAAAGNFSGNVTAASFSTVGGAVFKNLISSPSTANDVAATFTSFSSHLNNVVDFVDPLGAKMARITAEGTFATNSRVVIGGNNGNSIAATYSSTTPALWVSNSSPSAPVARLVANASQTGKLIEMVGSGAANKFTVDNNGNTVISGTTNTALLTVNSTGNPVQFFNGYQPLFEVLAGTETGTYNQSIVMRHANTSGSALARSQGLVFKFSDESSSGESAKWSGVLGTTALASSASPELAFYTAGAEAGRFTAAKSLVVGGDLLLSSPNALRTQGGTRAHWFLSSDETSVIGLQTNTTYMRSPAFAWYTGGTHTNSQFDPGTGGTQLMKLISSSGDTRLTVPRLTLTSTTPFDSLTPIFAIGDLAVGDHMQFANNAINVLNTSQNGSVLNIQNGGGNLVLGDSGSKITVPSQYLTLGTAKIFFGLSVFLPGSPANNDWWFDGTNEQIKIRRGDNTWHVVAG